MEKWCCLRSKGGGSAKFEGPGSGTTGGTIEIESEEGWEQLVGRYLIVQMDNGKHPLHFNEVTAFGKALSLA